MVCCWWPDADRAQRHRPFGHLPDISGKPCQKFTVLTANRQKKRPCPGGGRHDRFLFTNASAQGGGEPWRFFTRCRAGGGALASWFPSVPTREEVGGSETFIKRRHPGGGGCRHLIYNPKPREEVKPWVLIGSATIWEEDANPNFVSVAVGGLVCDFLNGRRGHPQVREITRRQALQLCQCCMINFALGGGFG